jgi:hypothetical protein
MKLGWGLLFLCASVSALQPPTCAELNRLWETKFHADYKVAWKEANFACPSPAAHLARAFFDVMTPKLPYPYYENGKKWIKSTHMDLSCTDSYAYVVDDEMHLCKSFFESDHEESAGTIAHEAAHGRHEDPGHVKCHHGEHKHGDACDDKLLEAHKGSGYNFEFMYYTQLLALGSYNILSSAVVKSYVKHGVLNNFNEVTPEQIKRWAD